MTLDEMREQKVRLRVELEEAQEHLEALRVKAAVIGDKVQEISVALRSSPQLLYRDGTSIHYKQNIDSLLRVSDSHVGAMDIRPILALADEIRKEMSNIETIKERLGRH